jgi:hypothetical protein
VKALIKELAFNPINPWRTFKVGAKIKAVLSIPDTFHGTSS